MRDTRVPAISATRALTAALPMLMTGWRRVVSGGSVKAISGESSKPTTERSSGTRSPRPRAARITPSAIRSDPQTIAVCPVSISSPPATWPPSTVKSVDTTCPVTSVPGERWSSRVAKAAILRREGTYLSGPTASPTRVWPRLRRWRTARLMATASSVDTEGASTPAA